MEYLKDPARFQVPHLILMVGDGLVVETVLVVGDG